MKTITNRIHWIDWAKVIAIYIVIVGHMPGVLTPFAYAFHMPLFFMISGFLQKKRDVRTELVNSLKCLLTPYIIFNVYLLIYSHFTGEYNPDYPIRMLTGHQWFLSMACRPLWFLLALFYCRMAYTLLPRLGVYVLAIAAMLACWIMNGSDLMKPEHDWFQYWTAMECFPFFILGSLVKQYNLYQKLDGWNKTLRIVFAMGIFALGAYLSTLNGGINLFRCHPGDHALFFYLNATLMSAGLLLLIYWILNRPHPYIQLVSEGTLLIFAMHQSILWPLHQWVGKQIGLSVWVCLLLALCLLVTLSGLVWLSKRYCPVLIGKWK